MRGGGNQGGEQKNHARQLPAKHWSFLLGYQSIALDESPNHSRGALLD
jgi:hypothetical protein